MQSIKKPTIWRYLIWGLVIGGLGSFAVVKFALSDVLSKTKIFQQIFGMDFSYEMTNIQGNNFEWNYYRYALDFLRFLFVGFIMGIMVGISNYSIRKTIYSVLAGLIAGIFVFNYYSCISDQSFLYHVSPLLFWYAAAIILCLSIIEFKNRTILIHSFLSLIIALLVAIIVHILGWFSLGITIGRGFAGRTTDAPQIAVGIIAMTFFNIAINFNYWKKLSCCK